jgi:hypothetical protein
MSTYNTGIASEYLILSMLYRLDLDAYMTLGNKKSVDISICRDNKVITLDVKAVKGYSSIIVNNATYKEGHYIAFVIYNNKINDVSYLPDIFIVPSLEVRRIVRSFGDQKRVMKSDILQYKDKWDTLKLF